MSEIKFACPSCGQHIACDRDYADMCIVCPECHQPMEVPRLSAAAPSHPDLCLVASRPAPKRRMSSRIPTIDLWTEREWEQRYSETASQPQQTPAWIISALGTIIGAAILRAMQVTNPIIIVLIVAGTALSCYLMATKQAVQGESPNAGRVVSLVLTIGLLILAIPVVALGVLFLGCLCAH